MRAAFAQNWSEPPAFEAGRPMGGVVQISADRFSLWTEPADPGSLGGVRQARSGIFIS